MLGVWWRLWAAALSLSQKLTLTFESVEGWPCFRLYHKYPPCRNWLPPTLTAVFVLFRSLLFCTLLRHSLYWFEITDYHSVLRHMFTADDTDRTVHVCSVTISIWYQFSAQSLPAMQSLVSDVKDWTMHIYINIYIYTPWLDTESSVEDFKSSNSTHWRQETGPLCQRAFTLRLKKLWSSCHCGFTNWSDLCSQLEELHLSRMKYI